jgi:hypothetical protein
MPLLVAERRAGEVVAELLGLAAVGPGQARLRPVAVEAAADLEVVGLALEVFAHHDVDGAGDGARAMLGHRGAHDLDALDLFRRDRVQRKAGWHALAVDQDLRVAGAHAPHADGPAAAGRAADGDAGQALEHLAERAVAHAVQLLAAVDDARGGGAASVGVVVRTAGPGDLDLLRPPRGPARRRGGRCGAGRLDG